MTETWPPGVPQYAEIQSYSQMPAPNKAVFTPSVWPGKQRRRSAMRIDDLKFEIFMLQSQYDTLITWWRGNLFDGVLRFTTKHPRDVTGSDVTFQFKENTEPPTMKPVGPLQCYVTMDVWHFRATA